MKMLKNLSIFQMAVLAGGAFFAWRMVSNPNKNAPVIPKTDLSADLVPADTLAQSPKSNLNLEPALFEAVAKINRM